MNDETEVLEREVPVVFDTTSAGVIVRQEIDSLIAAAQQHPRSIQTFKAQALTLATQDEPTANECIYALPRDGKVIEGPSARFAEIIAYAWRNCRYGARIVDESEDFITAQGVFTDLQQISAVAFEVRRRIKNSKGRRYSLDMIGVTGNAAASIALRNAVLKGIPKAFWSPAYQRAREVVMGNFETLVNRREQAIQAFVPYGISLEQICALLGVKGREDIGLEQLVALRGTLTAIKDGDTTPEQAFALDNGKPPIQRPQQKQPDEIKGDASVGDAALLRVTPENDAALTAVKNLTKGISPSERLPGMYGVLQAKIAAAIALLGPKALTVGQVCEAFNVQSLPELTEKQLEQAIGLVMNPPGMNTPGA